MWSTMPLILILERQRQSDPCDFKTNLVYIVEFQATQTAKCDPV